jgi:phospholipid transport system substrate-binding protein
MLKRTITTLLLCVCTVIAQATWASPLNTLEGAANDVLNALKKNKANLKSNPKFVYSVVNRYIIPHVDVYGMSRSVLGRDAWRKASKDQRQSFTVNFTNLVVRTYSGALRDYTGEKVKFLPIRGGFDGKRFVRVKSFILRPSGNNIPITYSMVNKKNGWKVYDMSVEGVSLLQSYKSQFSQYLQSNTLDQLIAKLKSRSFKRG